MSMFKRNIEKTNTEQFEEGDGVTNTNLVKRVPNKKFDNQYLNRYQKVKNDEIMNPEIENTGKFEGVDSYDMFEKTLKKNQKKRIKRKRRKRRKDREAEEKNLTQESAMEEARRLTKEKEQQFEEIKSRHRPKSRSSSYRPKSRPFRLVPFKPI